MRITVNGEIMNFDSDGTILNLFDKLGVSCDSVAVMIDGEVVMKKDLPSAVFVENSNIDILTLAAGGA